MSPSTDGQNATRRHESRESRQNKHTPYAGKGLDSSVTISPRQHRLRASASDISIRYPMASHATSRATIGAHSRRYVRRDIASAGVDSEPIHSLYCAVARCDWIEIRDGLCAAHYAGVVNAGRYH